MRQEQNNHHFQTPIVREKPVSMESKLMERWTLTKTEAEAAVVQADYNLGRISLIYSGQLMMDFEAQDNGKG